MHPPDPRREPRRADPRDPRPRRRPAGRGRPGRPVGAPIARELGLVSSAVYRYFPSRDDLLTALHRRGVRRPRRTRSRRPTPARAGATTSRGRFRRRLRTPSATGRARTRTSTPSSTAPPSPATPPPTRPSPSAGRVTGAFLTLAQESQQRGDAARARARGRSTPRSARRSTASGQALDGAGRRRPARCAG